MKRTNIMLDEKKIKEAKKAFDIETTKDLVDFALTEILKMKNRKELLKLRGKITLDIDLNKTRVS